MIRLISTDFDGTLVGWDDQARAPRECAALWDAIATLRDDAGVAWAINTGRTLDFALEGLRDLTTPILPDYLLTMEREIYRPDAGGGWIPFGHWNERCAHAHALLFDQARDVLAEIVDGLAGGDRAEVIYQDDLPVGLAARSADAMDDVVAWLDTIRARLPALDYQRNRIWLRFSHADYHKGSTLGELGRLLGLTREQIFAVGDECNDLPMLDGTHAHHVACPSNSIDPVKRTVRDVDGHVADLPYGQGVLQALALHFPEIPAPR